MNLNKLPKEFHEELTELHETSWIIDDRNRFACELLKTKLFIYTQMGFDVKDFWRYTERI